MSLKDGSSKTRPSLLLLSHSCSDSSDDEAEDTVTSTPKLPPAGAAGPPADDLEGSKTKYLPPEEDSDDSDEPQAAGGKEAGKTYAYADLDLVKGGDGVRSKEEEPGGDYVTLKPQPPAPAPSPPAFKVPPSAGMMMLVCMVWYGSHFILIQLGLPLPHLLCTREL